MHLRVGGLGDNTTEDELMMLFSKIGTVASVKMIGNIGIGMFKRSAIVHMPVDNEGEEAIKRLHGSMLADKTLLIMKMPQILPGEIEFREWFGSTDNVLALMQKIGVRDQQIVLDYGCGLGMFSIACASIIGRNGKVYALDVRSIAFERLKELASSKGLHNIETMLIDTSNISLKLADESVDVILLYDVLHEIDDKPGLFEELYRILRPDGLFSVFPMHIGTEKCLDIINSLGLFQFRDSYSPPGLQSASEVINLKKKNDTPHVS
jgi:SAM-dependent methyltransferase